MNFVSIPTTCCSKNIYKVPLLSASLLIGTRFLFNSFIVHTIHQNINLHFTIVNTLNYHHLTIPSETKGFNLDSQIKFDSKSILVFTVTIQDNICLFLYCFV